MRHDHRVAVGRLLTVTSCVAMLAIAPRALAASALVGTFSITAGADSAGGVVGSHFRMIVVGGTASGPFLSNGSSGAADQTYTFLSPGTDGGLRTGSYQPEPVPAFDGTGNSLSARITTPAPFFGVNFSTETAAVDPQTSTGVPAPALSHDGAGHLSGDLRALGAAWNAQEFNQGAPKPDGSSPGITAGPTGTYNAGTGAYTLDWTSVIVGGPFNGFTGKWHLEGTFTPLVTTTTTTVTTSTSATTSTLTSTSTVTTTTVASTTTTVPPVTTTSTSTSVTTTSTPPPTTTTTTLPSGAVIPVAGKTLLLGDNENPAKKKLAVQASDPAIGLGAGNGSADDPRISGASVRVVSATFDDTYTLPGSNWSSVGKTPNKGYKYKDKLGTFKSGLVKVGKPGKPGTIKLGAKGAALGHSLLTDPEPVSVVVTIGDQRFWSRYGGTIKFKAGKSFKAQNAPAPTGSEP